MASKCGLCQKAVYPNDSHLNLDSQQYHTGCAKCADCRCQITLSNFCKSGNLLLCKTHYYERFSVKGSYAGSEKYKKASTANSAPVVPVGIAPASSSSSARNERKHDFSQIWCTLLTFFLLISIERKGCKRQRPPEAVWSWC